ncbi:TIGR00730 family Rossman fold protein [Baekduia soli]|uniref:Cytokinin riboside 5'-monophosphate phosphoribohydrolase n=1 Tax=Baekduia soli TaxID=496014 RepID=A0A5B8U286_9ACTN|nr:TIGR00730 family Rossman fold protein [Baekduia soli]QEC47126.1 TIGR00730 family Rossman fold protein [Baekduia soli]
MSSRWVCVYAGSAEGADPTYARAASALAGELARRGAGVVYGGGSLGLMGVVADAALAAGGEVVGVIPRFLDEREIAHPGLTALHVTETMHDRKMRMADLADAFVVLPGGIGTLEEVAEMLSWSQLGLHRKPIGLLDTAGFWGPLVALLDHMTVERFVGLDHRRLLLARADPVELLDAMDAWEPPPIARRWLHEGDET